ncbi:MAG: hypothetical protein GWN58_66115 [Anaerolineae bacterium]|nr:hypothetical protein [Anaerolineae bacterium]
MPQILVVLQNAYATTAYRRAQLRKPDVWACGLWASHTGRRLTSMLPAGCTVRVINASPRIGKRSSDCFPPEPEHIRAEIEKHRPSVILACGKQAQAGLEALGLPHISAPHPAWRQLSNEHASEVRQEVEHALESAADWQGQD